MLFYQNETYANKKLLLKYFYREIFHLHDIAVPAVYLPKAVHLSYDGLQLLNVSIPNLLQQIADFAVVIIEHA